MRKLGDPKELKTYWKPENAVTFYKTLISLAAFVVFVLIIIVLHSTPLRKHDWLEAWGTWVGGIGTLAAVVAALYISRSDSNRREKEEILESVDQLKLLCYYLRGPLAAVHREIESIKQSSDVRYPDCIITHNFSIKHLFELPKVDKAFAMKVFDVNFQLDIHNNKVKQYLVANQNRVNYPALSPDELRIVNLRLTNILAETMGLESEVSRIIGLQAVLSSGQKLR